MANPTLVGIGAAVILNGVSGTNGAVSVPLPTGVAAGDTLVTFYMTADSGHATSTPVTPAGWSVPASGEYATALTSYYGWTAYTSSKVAGSSEPSSYSFAVAGISGGAYTYARMVAFRGGAGVDGLASVAIATSGTALTVASKTPTVSNDAWLSFLYDWSTKTAPSLSSGWTNIATASNSAIYVSTRAEYKNLSTTSATGTATSTSSGGFNTGSDQPGAVFSVLVKGASSGTAYALSGAAGSFSLSGKAASANAQRSLSAAVGAFSVNGKAATAVHARFLQSAAGAFTLTGLPATVKAARTITAAAGSFTLTGVAAALAKPGHAYALSAAAGSFAATGVAATVQASRRLAPAAGAFTLSGQSATLAASGHAYTMAAGPGSFSATGYAVTTHAARGMAGSPGAFSLGGKAAGANRAARINAAPGGFSVQGYASAFARAHALPAASGSFSLAGVSAVLNAARGMQPSPGAFAATGQLATLNLARQTHYIGQRRSTVPASAYTS